MIMLLHNWTHEEMYPSKYDTKLLRLGLEENAFIRVATLHFELARRARQLMGEFSYFYKDFPSKSKTNHIVIVYYYV